VAPWHWNIKWGKITKKNQKGDSLGKARCAMHIENTYDASARANQGKVFRPEPSRYLGRNLQGSNSQSDPSLFKNQD
jgi:hypothetical protein